uniref:Uncharacterized protein n=1 Tax=Acrobeloides nanus TaxID=290746 RepID=A0A914E037_9BILA
MTLYGTTSHNIFYTIFIGFIITFGIVKCVLVIYGEMAMKSWAFLPYLVMTGIGITFILLMSIILFAHSLLQQDIAFKNIEDDFNIDDGFNGLKLFKNKDEDIDEFTAKIACMATTINIFCMSVIGLLLSSLLPIGFWIVVFQSYRYVKNRARSTPPTPSYDAIEILNKL